jgi:3-phenylpropionate/trans-cinnamate dioxygenase ferredoxin reductase subunit
VTVDSIAIVGGGIAGISAAKELRAQDFTGELVLIDEQGLPYDRPPLSKKFLLGTASSTDLLLATPDWYESARVRVLTGSPALRLSGGSIELADGRSVEAEAVILATGSEPRRLPINGSGAPNVHVLRTLGDAIRLRDRMSGGTRLTIIGAGLIGAEVASSARSLGLDVTLIDPMLPPLSHIVGEELARYLHDQHAQHGIRSIQGTVDSFETDLDGACTAVTIDSGELIPTDELLVGIGVLPATVLAEVSGIDVDGGIIVDSNGRTSRAGIFAAGDVARLRTTEGSLLRRTEHWEAARVDGITVANTVLGRPAEPISSDWFWSDREGLHLEVAGSLVGPGTIVHRGALGDETFALFRVHEGHLVAAASVNDSMAVRAARRLIESCALVDPTALGDPDVSLRKLARA